MGLGVLVGCTPLYGLQTLLALALAWPLRLNKVAVVAGTQVSLPPFVPLLAFGGANVGELLLHQRLLPMDFDQLGAMSAAELASTVLVAWGVGSVPFGLFLGTLAGLLTAGAARRFQSRRAAATAD